nr:MAG TPA: hypothetical protein [Caudoviricetes sp.]
MTRTKFKKIPFDLELAKWNWQNQNNNKTN